MVKNEKAIEAIADIFDYVVEIAADEDVKKAARSDDKLQMVKLLCKNHAKSIFSIMAIMEGVSPDEYECDIMTLPLKLVDLFNRPEFTTLFFSHGQKEA